MTTAEKLYVRFRNYVNKSQLNEYDNEFMSKKRHSHQFMIPFIYKYIDIEREQFRLEDENKLSIIAFFLNDYCVKHSDLHKNIQEAKNTKRHIDRNFLFKDSDS